jgi:hypothetical protein
MPSPRYPSLYQINTRVRLSEIAAELGRPATLDDVTDAELDGLAADGFDLVWLLGVWQTGDAARAISRTHPALREEYTRVLPAWTDDDVTGSCFAVREYHVHRDFGGDAALARLRGRMRARGLRLVLDFVPNHVAPDHPWVSAHPEYFVAGREQDALGQPQNWGHVDGRVLAYGRDPYFDGWSDTLQLNYAEPALQAAMTAELRRIARQCDGVRCDMAMLLLPEVFARTWGRMAPAFWPQAIEAVRQDVPGFLFVAEVYWDLEWTLQQQGFDYAYDKRLYDRLAHGDAAGARAHLAAGLDYQGRLARFLENHDEPRAAATFAPDAHRAAAVITFLSPGLRFFHQGQREGRRVRIPVQLRRGPTEAEDPRLRSFYERLLSCLRDPVLRDGDWQLLDCLPAWDGNPSHEAFVAFAWAGSGPARRLVAVNYANHRSQCWIRPPWSDLPGADVRLTDLMGPDVYDRPGAQLASRGLYLDMPAWGHHVFDFETRSGGQP